ncbi:NAD(P)-binding protein [Mollisia scopiformis]|uniref:NAD(P)-binding protein n=1 Tax=Mollisia scopiformis TaxID=149040 RepID=A0A194X8D8_MOLSC|nr:NAD(P)-binding protein [Mollisia scopiformis]KUJ16431.1 NAD(P)-binding protein [Mollisia scopiformis]
MYSLLASANRGIGLNLAKAFAALSWDVTGSVRPQTKTDPSVKELEATGAKILEIEFLVESSIIRATKEYGDKPIDVLLNVGGLSPNPKPWQEQTSDLFMEKFQTMAVGRYLTTKHFLPNLEKSPSARVVNVSSTFGSVTDNTFGTCMAYRVAKASLNQVMVTFAREFENEGQNITVVCVEPGFLPTRLTGYDFVDDMDTSIASLMKVIQELKKEDSGSFIEWSGKRLRF